MHQADDFAELGFQRLVARLGGGEIDFLRLFDQGTDPVGARPRRQRAADGFDHLAGSLQRYRARVDRRAARRLLAQFRDLHVAEIGDDQGARNRRRGHHQHVDGAALARQRQPLVHAEAVLLVDHREREIAKLDAFLEQRMGAHEQIDSSGVKRIEQLVALGAAFAAGEYRKRDAGRLGERGNALEMLPREDFGRRHDRRLMAGLDHVRGRQAAPRGSCPSPRRPAAAAACVSRKQDRRRFPRSPCAASL